MNKLPRLTCGINESAQPSPFSCKFHGHLWQHSACLIFRSGGFSAYALFELSSIAALMMKGEKRHAVNPVGQLAAQQLV